MCSARAGNRFADDAVIQVHTPRQIDALPPHPTLSPIDTMGERAFVRAALRTLSPPKI